MKPSHLIFDKSDLFKDYFLEDDDKSINALPNFNKINIIIGANNSGKSRFIRSLISLNGLKVADIHILDVYNNYVAECNSKGYGDI